MNLNFKNMPNGSLPYDNVQSCKKMVLRLYDKFPFLPELPLLNPNDTTVKRTLYNLPCLKEKDGRLLLPESNNDQLQMALMHFDKIYNSESLKDFEQYAFNTPFMEIFEAMLEKFQPKNTILHILGPFSFANIIFNRKATEILTDRNFRKYVTQTVTLKALWFIHKVKSISPKTTPIIMFNENLLYKFGNLKRINENITNDTVITILTKVFERVKKTGALIGVQSFTKCNWQLVFDTNLVDIISFDAYNNPNNLNILAQSVNNFLSKGGYINWAITPVMNENVIRSLNIELLFNRFINTIENLASLGVSVDLLYRNSTVSVQGDLSKFPILFAEKALMLTEQLGKRIPNSSSSIQQNN